MQGTVRKVLMAWREVHFIETDEWTGNKSTVVWRWQVSRLTLSIMSHNNELRCFDVYNDYAQITPSEVKRVIENHWYHKKEVTLPLPKEYKHTTLDTVNFNIIIRDLVELAEGADIIGWNLIYKVMNNLKIHTDLVVQLVTVLQELGVLNDSQLNDNNDMVFEITDIFSQGQS